MVRADAMQPMQMILGGFAVCDLCLCSSVNEGVGESVTDDRLHPFSGQMGLGR